MLKSTNTIPAVPNVSSTTFFASSGFVNAGIETISKPQNAHMAIARAGSRPNMLKVQPNDSKDGFVMKNAAPINRNIISNVTFSRFHDLGSRFQNTDDTVMVDMNAILSAIDNRYGIWTSRPRKSVNAMASMPSMMFSAQRLHQPVMKP